MSHGHTKIKSKGLCIYCKRSDIPLTDEHIVPLSLGGQHVLLKASCHACANITKKFEQDVARELWGDARISYNAPSRRKRERKTHITLPQPTGEINGLVIPYNDYPAPLVFYKMHQSGFLQGLSSEQDISNKWQLVAIVDDERLKRFKKKYPEKKLTAKFKHVHTSFAKLIAKIGYGHALSILDINDFQPICLPYILGEKKNISFIVGGRFNTAAPDKDLGYILRTAAFGSSDHIIIISEVRLLANNETPTYHVIVGDVVGNENVTRILNKLGTDKLNTFQPNAIENNFLGENHWLPRATILPV